MNIQIFGIHKSFDTKKAQRFFKERGIRFQFVDLKQKAMSAGELKSVIGAVGNGVDGILDQDNQNYAMIHYLTEDAKIEKLMEEPLFLKMPVVRNGKFATIGYAPEVWKTWFI